MANFFNKFRPTILLSILGLLVVAIMGLIYNAKEATAAAITGIVLLSRDVIAHDDKVTDAETSVKIHNGT